MIYITTSLNIKYHFNIYFEAENGNIFVNIHFVNELQKNFFTKITCHEIENISKEIKLVNRYFYSEEEGYYNIQQLYYNEKFEEIKKITY